VPDAVSLTLALVLLAASLAAAAIRPRLLPDWLAAGAGAGVLVALGVIAPSGAWDVISDLGPTLGLLIALLVLAAPALSTPALR
jgi:arsenical pump membrane protein